jgi:brefeldin A-inhibited guanine nucleotide-exchange protein
MKRLNKVNFRLGIGVLHDFNKLRVDSQNKNIIAWTPVVAEIVDGFCRLDGKDVSVKTTFARLPALIRVDQFAQYLSIVYPLATDLLSRDVAPEIRQHLKTYFERVGYVKRIVEVSTS